jgi:DNA-binding NtrC family response regulator
MEKGHACTMCINPEDVVLDNLYDVVLVSTFVDDKKFHFIKKRYPDAIVILLASALGTNAATVLKKYGAKDYILKPFMMEQLLDKIEHYISYKLLEMQCKSYEKYLSHQFSDFDDDLTEDLELEFPLFVNTNNLKMIDAFVLEYIKNYHHSLYCISMKKESAIKELQSLSSDTFVYVTDFHTLNSSAKELFMQEIVQRKVLVANTTQEEISGFNILNLKNGENIFTHDSILQIEEYVKYIIRNFQDKFNDTELSRRLGISRKSVWEKRKRYAIAK